MTCTCGRSWPCPDATNVTHHLADGSRYLSAPAQAERDALADAAEVGRAVARLPEFVRLEKVGDHWRVLLYGTREALDYAFALDTKWHTAMSRPTIPEAVVAALGPSEGERTDV